MTEATPPPGAYDDSRLLRAADWVFPGGWPERIGVAVSGGGDSMALLHLLARNQARRGCVVHAVTVDHRLRAEAADEARTVARFCKTLGVPHQTLVWDHGRITQNLQDTARRARYRLIGEWALATGIGHVAIGHTADDQAETFLMGLARQAGIDGLSGMRGTWDDEGIAWSRPLLRISRMTLRDYLLRNRIDWIEDPSNQNEDFTRIKARKVLGALEPLGITVEKLTGVVHNLSSAQNALRVAACEKAVQLVRESAGELMIDRETFRQSDTESNRRIVIGALRWIARPPYPPRAEAIERFCESIRTGRDATLAGCRLKTGGETAVIRREPSAIRSLETPTGVVWDNRWRLSGPHAPNLTVRQLGPEGLRQCPDWRSSGYSRATLLVSPAIWRGDRLISAPLAAPDGQWTAEIVQGFHSFLLSH
ncbi:MAG: tRNA lysidine(34) synthetase TilS [Rhodobacteraceae bacterium]|nr:tRNA lysidine(34) synthetase TilS [Paracoccaceae bacterium]